MESSVAVISARVALVTFAVVLIVVVSVSIYSIPKKNAQKKQNVMKKSWKKVKELVKLVDLVVGTVMIEEETVKIVEQVADNKYI